jgi:dinuclear metal center YbgI/SA1388 family protein
MKISELINYIESFAPLSSQESYDNCGLLVGDRNSEITGVLVSLDCVEKIIDEAIEKKCNVVVSHHPIVFKGLKTLTGKNYIERTLIKAIQHNIAIYAAHTNLDNYRYGVNFEIGNRIGLKNLRILAPKENVLTKLIVYVPFSHVEVVKTALFSAGAGHIGNYDQCNFTTEGKGGFRPLDGSSPFVGSEQIHTEIDEVRLEVMVSTHRLNHVIAQMKQVHPYEEVAYDCIKLENKNEFEGSGMIGELEQPIATHAFLLQIKEKFKCQVIRHTAIHKEEIQRVAFCGGSGSFLLSHAIRQRADIFITGDYKYHDFFDSDNQIVVADIGHYESEQYTIELIHDNLIKKFTNFAVHLTELNTNPVNYL